MKFPGLRRRHKKRQPKPCRHGVLSSRSHRIEPLEDRCLLSAAPTLAAIGDVEVRAGAPLHIALDGFDADGDALSYLATSSSADVSTFIPQDNRSLRMTVEDYGQMTLELFEGRTPKTTARIIELAELGFYDGTIFHRIMKDFMIQGGSSDGEGMEGSGITFDDEFHLDLRHTSSRVFSMANSGRDSNDSQFFITSLDTRWLDFKHNVFGFLTGGDDVRAAIEDVPVDEQSAKPFDDVVLSSVEVFLDQENGVLMLSAPREITSGEADVTVTVSDGHGGTAEQTFHVDIIPDFDEVPNYPPVLTRIDDTAVQGGGSKVVPLHAFDGNDDPLTYEAESSDETALTVTVQNDQLILAADADALGVVTVMVTVTDGESTDNRTFEVEIHDPNNVVPVFSPLEDVTVQSTAPLNVALSAIDGDGDELFFYATSSNPDLELDVFSPQGNRSLRMSVEGYGEMVFELFESHLPTVTGEVIAMAEAGTYDGAIFDTVVDDVVVFGGAVREDGSTIEVEPFDDEFFWSLQHTSRGTLSLISNGRDANGARFAITGDAVRGWDFANSVFGYLTEGEQVLEAIEAVSTDPNTGKPLENVVISSVEVIEDSNNGVLILSVPAWVTEGEADVTVTVDDGRGGTAVQTFHVTVEPDTVNNYPFLSPIPDIHTTVDTPITFNIPGMDIENAMGVPGNELYYWGAGQPFHEDLEIVTLNDDGLTTITPRNGLHGVFGMLASVRSAAAPTFQPNWDTQLVPIFIEPTAPTSVELLPASDTGFSDSDGLTQLNNTVGNTLQFRVSGVMPAADVRVLADGEQIGHAVASGDSVVVTTSGAYELIDGDHAITAEQSFGDYELDLGNRHETVDLVSALSPELPIAIKSSTPQFVSDPILSAYEGRPYVYDVQTEDELTTNLAYSLVTSPDGMSIGNNGLIHWVPQPGQGPSEPVVVRVVDAAGNDAAQAFDVTIEVGPVIDFQEMLSQNIPNGGRFAFITSRAGRLTIEALFAQINGNIDLELLNDADELVGSSATQTDNERIDVVVGAGEIHRLVVTGSNAAVTLRFANLLVDDGSQLLVHGSEGNDTIEVIVGSPHRLTTNGVSYNIDSAAIRTITIDGHGGQDEAVVTGTSADDTASLGPGGGQLIAAGYEVNLSNVSSITLDGGGGANTAKLFDSSGDDNLVTTSNYGRMSGDGFHNQAIHFDRVDGYSSAGDDVAKMYDSPGDDTLLASPGEAVLFGDGFYSRAKSFSEMHVFATNGGHDTAELEDSPGDDHFYSSHIEGVLFGEGFYNRAKFFEDVLGKSSTGNDLARLFDSPDDDTFVAEPGHAEMNTPSSVVTVESFGTIRGYANAGGHDEAELYASLGDDLFSSNSIGGTLSGEGYNNGTKYFEEVHVFATSGGHDTAKLYDSPGDDTFVASPGHGEFSGNGFSIELESFPTMRAYATAGGNDTAEFHDSPGDDIFYGSNIEGALFNSDYYNRAKFFEYVQGISAAGGSDIARLYGTPGNDHFSGSPSYSAMSGGHGADAYRNGVESFPDVRAYGGGGSGVDFAELHDSPGDDLFVAALEYGKMSGEGFLIEVESFPSLSGFAEAGGYDQAKMYDSPGDDEFTVSEGVCGLSGNGMFKWTEHFERVDVYATAGGNDTATFNDTTSDEIFYGSPIESALFNEDYYVRGKFFEKVEVSALADIEDYDEAYLVDSPGDDRLEAAGNSARLWNDAVDFLFDIEVKAFSRVKATSSSGDDTKSTVLPYDFELDLEGPWQDL